MVFSEVAYCGDNTSPCINVIRIYALGPVLEIPGNFPGTKSQIVNVRSTYKKKTLVLNKIFKIRKYNITQCKVSYFEKASVLSYKEIYGPRNKPEKVSEYPRNGPLN